MERELDDRRHRVWLALHAVWSDPLLRPEMVAQFALPSGAPVMVYGLVIIVLGGFLSYKGFSS